MRIGRNNRAPAEQAAGSGDAGEPAAATGFGPAGQAVQARGRVVGQAVEPGVRAGGQRVQASGRVAAAVLRGAQQAGLRGAQVAGRGARWSAALLADQVLAIAPRLPVRSQAALRVQFPGRSPDEVAEALIEGAARTAAAAGAAAGTWAAVPFMPGYPAEVAAETIAVVGIEIKLIAELHETYSMRAAGSVANRMTGYVESWANRRGVVMVAPPGVILALGSPLRRRLQRRLVARAGRSAVSLAPLMTGAAAGAMINLRETRRLGRQIRDDLRRRSPNPGGWAD
ncbi:MAG: hypothetical protein ACLQDY_03260 [Streptosporangiaceae bacterium]